MARYVVEFRRGAEKDLRRLDPVVQRRVLRTADKLATDPRPSGCRKLQGSDNAYRVRVGLSHRLYGGDAVLIVAIERVRHRGEVYRELAQPDFGGRRPPLQRYARALMLCG